MGTPSDHLSLARDPPEACLQQAIEDWANDERNDRDSGRQCSSALPAVADTDDFESRQQPAQAVMSQSVDDRG